MGSLTKTVSFNVNQPKYGQDSSTVSVGETVTASQFFAISRNDVGSLTMASNSSLVANSSQPIFTGTVNISITEGVAGSYDFAQNFINPVDSYSLTGTLPVGFSFDDPTGVLSWTNAVTENTTPGFTVTATNASGVGVTDTFSLVVNAQPSGLTLAAGHYVPAVLNMTIVSPRPDAETSSDEANRLWPSQKAFRYAVNVRGGARPHNYELTSAPSGMTIGAGFGDTDYGIITWANPTIGTHTVTVRVRSQEFGRNTSGLDDEATVTFVLTVRDREDDAYFVWIDSASGNDANDGSYSSPKQDFGPLFDTSAHSGKQIHLLNDGPHVISETSRRSSSSSRPKSIIGNFSGSCNVNAQGHALGAGVSGTSHMGFNLVEAGFGTTESNIRYVYIDPPANRYKWFDGDIVNPRPGTNPSSNPTSFYCNRQTGFLRSHFVISHGEERGRTDKTAVCSLYNVSGMIEFFDCVDTSGSGVAFFLKDGNPDFGIYNCYSDTTNTFESYNQDTNYVTERVEIAYNRVRSTIRVNRAGTSSGIGEHWIYRNSILDVEGGQSVVIFNTPPGPINVFANAAVGDIDPLSVESQAELHDSGTGIFDANINLTGAARTTYLGTRGAEIE